MYFVYILECSDGSYYVGSTQDLTARVKLHNDGKGPAFTASRRPLTPVYRESFATLEEAVRRERQLKRWSHSKKEALITSDLKRLKESSKCRGLHGVQN